MTYTYNRCDGTTLVMEPEQPAPVGDPPSYLEVVEHPPAEAAPPQGDEGDGVRPEMNPKPPDYKWAEPTMCLPPAQYPPTLVTGPAPYGPAEGCGGYGQPIYPYYHQHQAGYAMPCCGMPATQHPHQQVVVVSGGTQPMYIQHVQSFAAYVVLSCVVLFCCNFILGCIAFILAIIASSVAVSDPRGARQLGHASLGVSIGGIAISTLIILIMFCVAASNPHKA